MASASARNAAEMLNGPWPAAERLADDRDDEQQHEERERRPVAGVGQREAGHDRPDQQPALTNDQCSLCSRHRTRNRLFKRRTFSPRVSGSPRAARRFRLPGGYSAGHRVAPVPPQDPAVRAAAHLLHAELDRRLRRSRRARGARVPRDQGPAGDLGAVHHGGVPARLRRARAHRPAGPAPAAPRAPRALRRRGRRASASWRCSRRRSRWRSCSCSRWSTAS